MEGWSRILKTLLCEVWSLCRSRNQIYLLGLEPLSWRYLCHEYFHMLIKRKKYCADFHRFPDNIVSNVTNFWATSRGWKATRCVQKSSYVCSLWPFLLFFVFEILKTQLSQNLIATPQDRTSSNPSLGVDFIVLLKPWPTMGCFLWMVWLAPSWDACKLKVGSTCCANCYSNRCFSRRTEKIHPLINYRQQMSHRMALHVLLSGGRSRSLLFSAFGAFLFSRLIVKDLGTGKQNPNAFQRQRQTLAE